MAKQKCKVERTPKEHDPKDIAAEEESLQSYQKSLKGKPPASVAIFKAGFRYGMGYARRVPCPLPVAKPPAPVPDAEKDPDPDDKLPLGDEELEEAAEAVDA